MNNPLRGVDAYKVLAYKIIYISNTVGYSYKLRQILNLLHYFHEFYARSCEFTIESDFISSIFFSYAKYFSGDIEDIDSSNPYLQHMEMI